MGPSTWLSRPPGRPPTVCCERGGRAESRLSGGGGAAAIWQLRAAHRAPHQSNRAANSLASSASTRTPALGRGRGGWLGAPPRSSRCCSSRGQDMRLAAPAIDFRRLGGSSKPRSLCGGGRRFWREGALHARPRPLCQRQGSPGQACRGVALRAARPLPHNQVGRRMRRAHCPARRQMLTGSRRWAPHAPVGVSRAAQPFTLNSSTRVLNARCHISRLC